MQIADLLSRAGVSLPHNDVPRPDAAQERAAAYALARTRLHALLPTSGIVLGPPETEDKLEISVLAHAILRAGDELDAQRLQRAERLRVAYLRGEFEIDVTRLAARMLPGLMAAEISGEEQAE